MRTFRGFFPFALRAVVLQDRDLYKAEVSNSVEHNFYLHDLKGAFDNIRKVFKYRPRPLPGILKADGTPAQTPQEARRIWLEHWAEVLKGIIVPFESIVNIKRRGQVDRFVEFVESEAIPDIGSLQYMSYKTKDGKAVGNDGLPGELSKRCHAGITQLFYPLILKAAITCREPLGWKGTENLEIPKKAKSCQTDGKSACRGVSVAHVIAKIYHRISMAIAYKSFVRQCSDTACGGVEHRGTDFASHLISSVQRFFKSKKKSVAIIFVNIVGAFDAVDRNDLFQEPKKIAERVLGTGRLLRTLEDAFDGTWASVQRVKEVVCTSRGCRPGDPWVDLVFNMIKDDVVRTMNRRLHGAGIEAVILYKNSESTFTTERVADGEHIPLTDVFLLMIWS